MASRPRADPSLTLTPGKGGARIETPDGALHYLNQTAAVIWLLCDGHRDEAALAEALAREFSLSEPPHAAVEQALALLRARGLLLQSG
ncbi:MAG: PqqD family peptide modification chaperone [Rhodobacteraceae bacterium]|nr:PqqD family peptide modification chaperone [Paracoccaceae bacterium]